MANKALGILLPAERGTAGYFNQGFDVVTQIKSNLINLVLTRKGERLMQPTFGCNIHDLMFDQITDETVAAARGAIEEAVQSWLPYLSIKNVVINKNSDSNEVFLDIRFSVRNNSITDSITLVI